MTNISVTAADIKAAQTKMPFSFHDLAGGNQFMLDHRNNSVFFRSTPNEGDFEEALEELKSKGFDESITLDHLVDYQDNKYLVVTNDLRFSVKNEMVGKVIRPNRAAWHYDMLIVKTNEGIGDIPAFIGYPISDRSCGYGYEIGLQYEEGGHRYFIFPEMIYYIPDDEGYKLMSEEEVPQNIISLLREREMEYIKSGDDIEGINKAAACFKELYFKTLERQHKLLK